MQQRRRESLAKSQETCIRKAGNLDGICKVIMPLGLRKFTARNRRRVIRRVYIDVRNPEILTKFMYATSYNPGIWGDLISWNQKLNYAAKYTEMAIMRNRFGLCIEGVGERLPKD